MKLTARKFRTLAAALAATLLVLGAQGCTLGGVDDLIDNPGPRGAEPIPASSGKPINAARVYGRNAPSVATVIVDYDGDGSGDGLGTGFAIDTDTLVTNVHVIGDLISHREAAEVFVQLRDGNRYRAKIVGTDSHADIALLRLGGGEPPALKAVRFGSSRAVQVGDQVAAIGAPLGATQSLAVGFVTGVDRTIPGLAGFSITGAIQTDAAITLGNSGGPLFNARGRVIGVNDQIATVGGGGEGLAFAVPAEVVRRSIRELRRDGKVEYAYLGARTRPVPPTVALRLGLPERPGVVVFGVRGNGPAKRAGLRGSDAVTHIAGSEWPRGGDFITAVNGRALRANEKLTPVLDRYRPGDTVRLTVFRDGGEKTIRVRLGSRPLIWGL